MKVFNTAYGIVRKYVFIACAGRQPSEWDGAVSGTLRGLQERGLVVSWSLSVNSRLQGFVVRVVVPGLPPATISVLPRAGRSAIIQGILMYGGKSKNGY